MHLSQVSLLISCGVMLVALMLGPSEAASDMALWRKACSNKGPFPLDLENDFTVLSAVLDQSRLKKRQAITPFNLEVRDNKDGRVHHVAANVWPGEKGALQCEVISSPIKHVTKEPLKLPREAFSAHGIADIVYCADSSYLQGVGASIFSVLLSSRRWDKLRFNVLTSPLYVEAVEEWLHQGVNSKLQEFGMNGSVGIGPGPKDYLNRNPNNQVWIDVQAFDYSLIGDLFQINNDRVKTINRRLVDPLNFGRYYVEWYWPRMKTFIYLDADSLIQRDIVDLWHGAYAMQAPLAAFNNCNQTCENWYGRSKYQHLCRPGECIWFAGVYVADLETWHKSGITAQLEEMLAMNKEQGSIKYGSQAPMLIAFTHKRRNLYELGWRYQEAGWPGVKFADHDILEWNGTYKPWTEHTCAYWVTFKLPGSADDYVTCQRKETSDVSTSS